MVLAGPQIEPIAIIKPREPATGSPGWKTGHTSMSSSAFPFPNLGSFTPVARVLLNNTNLPPRKRIYSKIQYITQAPCILIPHRFRLDACWTVPGFLNRSLAVDNSFLFPQSTLSTDTTTTTPPPRPNKPFQAHCTRGRSTTIAMLAYLMISCSRRRFLSPPLRQTK